MSEKPLFQYAYYPEGAYIITQDGAPVPPEQLCFMLESSTKLKAENEILREAHEILSGFSISSMFDAKGTYTKDKSDEWTGRLAQADALLTGEERRVNNGYSNFVG